MAGVIAVSPKFYFPGAEGGEVDVYLAGTTTRTDTWQDRALTVANENPVELNARAECVLWLDSALRYKFVVKNALGVTLYTVDNVAGAEPGTSSIAEFTVDRFSGDGSDTTFTLSVTPDSENATDVFVAGVYQQKNTYSVAGTTLTFAVAPASGTNNIEVVTKNILDYTDVAADVAVSVAAAAASETAAAASASSAAASATAADASADAAALSESQAAAIVLGNFLQSGTSAVERTFTAKARDIVSVFDFMTTTQISDVQAFTYGEDVTAAITAALTAAAGKTLYFPEGGYLTGRMLPSSNTTLVFDPGCTVRKKTNGTQVIKVAAKSDVHIIGNGCTFDGQTNADATSGDTVNFSDSHDCSMTNVHVLGAGTAGSDCIYIGSDGNDEPCTNIRILGGSCTAAKRNGISVAAGFNVLIEGVEISGTTGSPGAGIDIEANVYNMIGQVVIRNCRIHDNEDYGVVVVFGDDVKIYDNEIYDNGDPAIASGAGGTQFTAGVARSDIDIRAISSVNSATGELTISGGSTLEVGTLVVFQVRGTGVRPTGAPTGQCFVYSKSADNTKVILSSTGFSGITSFSDAGSGTLTADPTTSEMYLSCYEVGQSSNLEIFRNKCYGSAGTRGEIDVGTSVNVKVYDNHLTPEQDNSGVFFTFSRGLSVERNTLVGNSASVSASKRGLHFGVCSRMSTNGNFIKNFSGQGLNIGSAMFPGTFAEDDILNCGANGSYMVKLENLKKAKIRGVKLRTEGGYSVTNGIGVAGNVQYTTVINADCETGGSSNATSISMAGTGNRIINSTQYDGTYWGSGSASFNPASLADGARETATAITVTGASLGDQVQVSFSLNQALVKLFAYVSAADTVQPVFENESGGVVDLGSGTIYVQVSKR